MKVSDRTRGTAGPTSDVDSLEGLQAVLSGITDTDGIRHLHALRILDLSGNEIEDLSPLKELPRLTFLNLTFNKVGDLRPLKRLTTLRHLDLSVNKIIGEAVEQALGLEPLSGPTDLAAETWRWRGPIS